MKTKGNKIRNDENSRMTVGFDAKRALRNFTGLGNYSRYTIDAMSLLFPKNTYGLFAAVKTVTDPDGHIIPAGTDRANYLLERTNVRLITPASGFSRRFPALWRSAGIVNQIASTGVDVYHGLSNEIPFGIERSVPSVVTVHDVIWRRYPSDYSAVDRRLYDFKYGSSVRRATRVIAISECTRRDIISEFGIPEDKIEVIYQGIDPQFRHVGSEEVARVSKKYSLPPRYYVAVGTVQSRKNQILAVKALPQLPDAISLVIVGKRTSYADEIDAYVAQHGLSGRILWIPSADFADIPAIYSGALFSSYTSRYEGFGLPVVESIACHTPVIACTGSCLEEAGGAGAVYVDPDDVRAYAEAARRLTDDRYFHDKLVELGLRHIKRFDVGTFAEKTMKVYTSAILKFYL